MTMRMMICGWMSVGSSGRNARTARSSAIASATTTNEVVTTVRAQDGIGPCGGRRRARMK